MGAPDGFEQTLIAVWMITDNHDSIEQSAPKKIFGGLISCEEPRLHTSKLHHQTQQRRDNHFTGENQHVTQTPPARRGRKHSATYGPPDRAREGTLANPEDFLDILGTDVYPLSTSPRVTETICLAPVSSLSESTIKELRSALTEQLRYTSGPTTELADLIKRVGREAHQKSIPPEELIVVFKKVWNSLSETLHPQDVDQHELVRQRLVTLCIQAYYAE